MFNLPKHFLVSDDGHMYDTRKESWHTLPPLRKNYALISRDCDSIALRAAIRQKYTWGGYDLIAVTSDGGLLCMGCCRKEYHLVAWSVRHACNDGWRVTNIDAACNYDGPVYCDHCGRVIVEGEEE